MKYLLTVSAALLLTVHVYSQRGQEGFALVINISSVAAIGWQQTTTVGKKGRRLHLIYETKDSSQLLFSSSYRAMWARQQAMPEAVRTDSMNQLIKLHPPYRSLKFRFKTKEHKDLMALLEAIAKTPVADLKNDSLSRRRGILDGDDYRYTIKTGTRSENFNVHAPDRATHPLLYDLNEKLKALYEARTKKHFYTGRPL